jgi:hypothetical protein
MRNEWKEVDVAELESRGDIIIKTTEEVYFPAIRLEVQSPSSFYPTLPLFALAVYSDEI